MLEPTYNALQGQQAALVERELTDDGGLAALGILYGRDLITNRQLVLAKQHWLRPPEAFEDRNAWSLYQSVTEGLKHGEAGTLLSRHIAVDRWVTEHWVEDL